MLFAPVHVFFLVLEVLLHHVKGGQVVLNAVHALAQQLYAVNRHLVVSLEELDGILIQRLGLDSLLLEFAAQVEQTSDELVNKLSFFLGVFKILGLEFLKSERAKDTGLEFVLERLGIEVGYKKL